MYKHKRKIFAFILAIMTVLCLAAPAVALEVMSGGVVTVPEGKIEGPLFVSGNNIVINADVDGDVFAAGETVSVYGKISGDLLAVGNQVRINGIIDGDARVAAAEISVGGTISKSLTAAAGDIILLSGSRVSRDMVAAAGNMTLSGNLGRHFAGAGESVFLNNNINGDVRLWSVDELKIGSGAAISGNLVYGSGKEASVDPQAKIGGTTSWNQLQPREKPVQTEGFSWLAQLAWFAAGVLVWGVFSLVFPGIWRSLSMKIIQQPLPGLGWGFLFLLVTPLAALILLITVVGIPISLALITAYAALLYAGKIIIGDAIGRLLSGRFGWEKKIPDIVPFMTGFAILILLTNIPVVGFLANLTVAAMALGAVFLKLQSWRKDISTIIV
ncbi:MAG: hypothetical protein ACOY46_14860 [Bacillota bacterium]